MEREMRRASTIVLLLVGPLAACPREGTSPSAPPPPAQLILLDGWDRAELDPAQRALWATSVAAALIDNERAHVAASHLARATQHAAAMMSVADRTATQERIAYQRARAGSYELAIGIAQKMRSPKARASTWAAVIEGVGASGDAARAAQLLDETTDLDDTARGRAILAVTRAWSSGQAYQRAGATATAFRTHSIHDEALGEVAVAFAGARRIRHAEQAAEQIQNPHWRGAAEAAIAEAVYRKKRSRSAQRIAKSIDSPWMGARAYGRMTVVAVQRGRRSAARRFFERATALVEGISDPIVRSSATVEIVRTHLSLGRTTLATTTAQAITDPSTRGQALLEVLKHHVEHGDLEKAAAVLTEVEKNPLYADEGRLALATAASTRESVFTIARTIRAPEVRIQALARFAVREAAANVATDEATLKTVAAIIRGPVRS